MKSVATEVLLARVFVRGSLRGSPVRAAWLGAVACSMGFACAPSEDADRKFDIATSPANTDDKGDAQTNTPGDDHDAGSTTGSTKTSATKDVSSTEADASPDPTDEDPTEDSSTQDESQDASNDTIDEDSNDTSTTSGTTSSSTSEDSSQDTVGESSESGDTSVDTSEDTADTSEDTSVDTSDDTTDTTDDLPNIPSDIAELEWVIGGEGTGPGLFDDARFLAVDGDGNA